LLSSLLNATVLYHVYVNCNLFFGHQSYFLSTLPIVTHVVVTASLCGRPAQMTCASSGSPSCLVCTVCRMNISFFFSLPCFFRKYTPVFLSLFCYFSIIFMNNCIRYRNCSPVLTISNRSSLGTNENKKALK